MILRRRVLGEAWVQHRDSANGHRCQEMWSVRDEGLFPFALFFFVTFPFLLTRIRRSCQRNRLRQRFLIARSFVRSSFHCLCFAWKKNMNLNLFEKGEFTTKKKNGKSLGQVKAYVVASSQLGIVLVCVGCIGLGYDPLHILFFFLSTEQHRWLRKIGWVHCPERSILVSCIVALWWTVGQMAHSMLSKPSVPDTFGLLPSVDMYAFNLRPVRVPTIQWQCQSIKIMVTECLHWTLVRGNITQRQTNKERKSCGVNHIEMAANVTVGDVLSAFYSMMAHIGW